jgi:hypothetical protein
LLVHAVSNRIGRMYFSFVFKVLFNALQLTYIHHSTSVYNGKLIGFQ